MFSGGEGLGQEHPLPAMDHARQDPDDGSRFVRLPINVQRLRQDKRHQVLRPAGRLPLAALMLLRDAGSPGPCAEHARLACGLCMNP